MKKLVVLACGLMMVSGIASAAEVYKWKDTDGRIRYSDMPPPGKTPYEKLSGSRPAPAPAAPVAEAKGAKPAPAAGEKGAGKDKAEAENPQKSEQAKAEEKKVRDENCATAKANVLNYKQGGRLYRVDEKGERLYLDEKDIAASLEKANKDVEQWCGGQ